LEEGYVKVYKNRQAFDPGGGTGVTVTNAYFKHTAAHSRAFHFTHCNYLNFQGTELSWKDISVAVSDTRLNIAILNEYTDEQCFELIMQHVSAKAMFDLIDRLYLAAKKEGAKFFKEELRRMILE
jgi:hypothetical protein